MADLKGRRGGGGGGGGGEGQPLCCYKNGNDGKQTKYESIQDSIGGSSNKYVCHQRGGGGGIRTQHRKQRRGTPAPENNSWMLLHQWLRKEWKSSCSTASLRRKLPIIDFLRTYSVSSFQSDVIAGVTVGLTAIPQGIAYAAVAALPLQYGLYTAFMGCFIYCLLGSTREINIGPTAIIALLTAQQVETGGPAYAVALSFLCGVIELLFVVLNLGFLIDFISLPVISGFSSAAALIISATQLKGLLGLSFKEEKFIFVLKAVYEKIGDTKTGDLIMGVSCLIILLLLRKLGAIKWKDDTTVSTCAKVARKLLWLVCTARNALVVIVASIVAYILSANGFKPFLLTGQIAEGLPDFKPPPFSFEKGNTTVSFWVMCSDLGGSIVLIPLVSILEHIAIAKVFAQGRSVDAKQEFLALGVTNVLGSFVSAFPSTGSFSRTALNGSCGVKTPIAGLFTGSLVLLALGVLAPTFKYIPKSSLSAVIISAVVFMIEFEMVTHLWRTKKIELFVMIVTFISCLIFSAEYGILIGIALSLLLLLYTAARPRIRIERTSMSNYEYICIQPDQNLFFPAIEYLRFRIKKAKASGSENIPVVFDGSHISSTDFTIAQGIKQILDDFTSSKQKILFTNFRKEVLELFHSMEAHDLPHFTSVEEFEALVEDSPSSTKKIGPNSLWPQTQEIEFVEGGGLDIVKPQLEGVMVLPAIAYSANGFKVSEGIRREADMRAGLLPSNLDVDPDSEQRMPTNGSLKKQTSETSFDLPSNNQKTNNSN